MVGFRPPLSVLRNLDAMIHRTAVIGDPPESRDYEGPGLEPVIDSTAKVNAFVTVDAGINRPTTVGPRSLLMAHSHLGHDVVVCEDVEISTGAIVGGGCWIGAGARIGINATIRPRQMIGAAARVGAGAVVTRDVPPGATVVGNPARELS